MVSLRHLLRDILGLTSDPQENWNITATKMDNGWMMAPIYRAIVQYEMSVKKYPNIKPGEEFKGYSSAH